MTLVIRRAAPGDEQAISRLVRGLAEYERLGHEAQATPEALGDALFAPNPRVFCDLALDDGQPVGLALWFYNFSTFLGRHGIYLEDLFVEAAFRKRGIGRALMRGLAERCVREDLGGVEWLVLNWNEPAIEFYLRQGARVRDEWKVCRVTGEALRTLAEGRE